MKLRLILSCTFFFIFLFSGQFSFAQEAGISYVPAKVKTYGSEDGLPDPCIRFAHVDSLGRLTLEPCSHAQVTYNMPFYQLDGSGARFNNSSAFSNQEGYNFFRSINVTEDELIYGIIVQAQVYIKFYTYNVITGELRTFDLPQRFENLIALGNVLYENGKFELLCYNREQYHIAELTNDSVRIMRSFPNPHKQQLIGGLYPFSKLGEEYVFSDGFNIYQTNKDSLNTIIHNPEYLNYDATAAFERFYKYKDGILVADVGEPRTCYFLNIQTGQLLNYNRLLPENYKGDIVNTLVYQDDEDRLLTLIQYRNKEVKSFLTDKNGIISDYSAVVQSFSYKEYGQSTFFGLFGKDYTKQIIQTAYNFEVSDVTSSQGIRSIDLGPQRGLIELGDGSIYNNTNNLIVVEDNGLKVQRDAFNGASNSLHDEFIYRIDDDQILVPKNGSVEIHNLLDNTMSKFKFERSIIRCLVRKEKGSVIVMTVDGTFEIDLSTSSVKQLNLINPPSYTSQILENEDQILFVTSEGIYVSKFAENDEVRFSLLDPKLNIPANMMAVDEAGRFWIASFAQGVFVYDPGNGHLEIIDEKKGLSNNTVATLIQDDDGDFWIGTFNGVTIIDSSLNIIGHVYESDGLSHNECNRWSVTKLRNGSIVFGSISGLSIIDPVIYKQKIRNAPPFQIYVSNINYQDSIEITDISVLNSALREPIFLPASNRNLTIAYGVSDYANPEGASYAYKLKGKSEQWNYIGSISELALIDLPRGKYDLVIKGANYRGQQSVNQLVVPLHVGSFFYQTLWFYVLCALIGISSIIGWINRQKRIQRKLEKEVKSRTSTILQQKEELEQLDQFKSKLYTNITHEFRTPLTVIDGLADQFENDPQAPELIKRNTKNLLSLVNQMLDLRKLESKKMQVSMVQSDIVHYIKYIGESFQSIARSKNIEISYFLPDGDFLMDFDPEKLTRILGNLISNALKYTPESGKIEITGTAKADRFELSVSDTGIGIPKDKVNKIFDQYYQVDNEWTRTGMGTGIGLTLVYELVKVMGGTIRVESEEHVGSNFIVQLPITNKARLEDRLDKEEVIQMTSSIPTSSESLLSIIDPDEIENKPTILLVEDSPDILHYLILCIKDDYNVKIAHHGKEGLLQTRKWMPSVVISDVMMPEMTGYELCEALKSDIRTSHIPVILLTAKADQESKMEGLRMGADDYLAKPFRKEELLIRVRNLINMQSALHQRYTTFSEVSEGSNEMLQMEDQFISKFRNLILREMENERFGIPEMCKKMGMGKTQLHEKLKSLTGQTPIQYQRMIKLNEAKLLLETTNATVSEIAFNLGFKDPKYFSKVFKETYGESPSQFSKSS